MSARAPALLAALALAAVPVAVPAAEQYAAAGDGEPSGELASGLHELHRNPFERPALAAAPPSEVARPAPAPPPWTPVLKATMVSEGGRSLANVDGQMVGKGEDYQGYTLIDVREREAVFERGGNRWVLSLD